MAFLPNRLRSPPYDAVQFVQPVQPRYISEKVDLLWLLLWNQANGQDCNSQVYATPTFFSPLVFFRETY